MPHSIARLGKLGNSIAKPLSPYVRSAGIGDGVFHFPPYEITSFNSSSLAPRVSLNPFTRGPIMGINRLSSTPFRLSTMAYYPHPITTPAMLVFGQIGQRKSTFVKTYALRHSYLGVPSYIIDPKGEYGNYAEATGIPVIDPARGGVTPLARIPGVTGVDLAVRRATFVQNLFELYHGRPASPMESHAILGLMKRMDHIDQPILNDVIQRAAANDCDLPPEINPSALPKALENIISVLVLCRDELGHVLNVRPRESDFLARTKGLVVDVSAWRGESRRFAAVMMSAMSWLTPRLWSNDQKLLILDEAWAALEYEPFVRWLQLNLKLARSFGLTTIVVTHSPRNLGSQSADGTAAAKIAETIKSEFGTYVVFHLPLEDVAGLSQYGFAPWELGWIADQRIVAPGSAYVHVGSWWGLVDSVVTADELRICDTDAAMRLSR